MTCHRSLSSWQRVLCGLVNATSYNQRMIKKALEGLIGKICFIYQDGIIIYSTSMDLQAVLDHICKYNVHARLKPVKCKFDLLRVNVPDYVVTSEGISQIQRKVRVTKDMKYAIVVQKVRSFHWFCSFFLPFIPDFARVTEPQTPLTRSSP